MSAGYILDRERGERLMAMGQMAASLAHEIRNPLGSMELFCTLLKKDLTDEPERLKLAEQIHSGIRTLDRIITNCLQFTRETQPRRRKLDDVASYLAEVVEGIAAKTAEAQVPVRTHHSGVGVVAVDPYLFKQALTNLVVNAVDATVERRHQEGMGFVPTVEIESLLAEGNWTLRISDNGCGIPPEDRDRIFDPFYTTKSAGTGLGLAIVHSILLAHGATMAIETEQGRGTTVIVEIPPYTAGG